MPMKGALTKIRVLSSANSSEHYIDMWFPGEIQEISLTAIGSCTLARFEEATEIPDGYSAREYSLTTDGLIGGGVNNCYSVFCEKGGRRDEGKTKFEIAWFLAKSVDSCGKRIRSNSARAQIKFHGDKAYDLRSERGYRNGNISSLKSSKRAAQAKWLCDGVRILGGLLSPNVLSKRKRGDIYKEVFKRELDGLGKSHNYCCDLTGRKEVIAA